MNSIYGFKDQVTKKYSLTAYKLFEELFQYLPLAHLVNNRVLVIHGGLPSQDNVTLKDIEQINRFREPVENTVFFDLLWTDPSPSVGRSPSPRGVGQSFGSDVTKAFCDSNNLDYVIRSHECKMAGYEVSHADKCITIFSAPNYCDEMGNKGAFIHLRQDLVANFNQFEASPHPNKLLSQ